MADQKQPNQIVVQHESYPLPDMEEVTGQEQLQWQKATGIPFIEEHESGLNLHKVAWLAVLRRNGDAEIDEILALPVSAIQIDTADDPGPLALSNGHDDGGSPPSPSSSDGSPGISHSSVPASTTPA